MTSAVMKNLPAAPPPSDAFKNNVHCSVRVETKSRDRRAKSKTTSIVIAEEEMRTVSSFTPSCWLVSVIVVMSKMAGFHSHTHLLQGTSPERHGKGKKKTSLAGNKITNLIRYKERADA